MPPGDWAVQLEDGSHAVRAELIEGFSGQLKITWDGEVVASSQPWRLLGNLKSFERNGHSFLLRGNRAGLVRFKFALYMDGVIVPEAGMVASTTTVPSRAAIEFEDINVHESEEIVWTDPHPLDNSRGDRPLNVGQTVSRESINEVSIDMHGEVVGKIGLTVLSIKADIEAHAALTTRHKIGEKITESQTVTFSVGPRKSVLYEVIWKRKIRSGERLYRSGSEQVTVPYKIYYGLSCEVRSQSHAKGSNPSP